MFNVFDCSATGGQQKFVPFPSHNLASSMKGMVLMGKRNIRHLDGEVNRIFSLTGDSIETYGLCVTRKERVFAKELFPDTYSTQPALSADSYFKGDNKDPILVSVELFANESDAYIEATSAALAAASLSSEVSEEKKVATNDAGPGHHRLDSSAYRAQIAQASETRLALNKAFARTIYLHTAGIEPGHNKDHTYFMMKVSQTQTLGRSIVCNSKYFATPWHVAGGSAVYVKLLSNLGRTPDKVFYYSGHVKQVSSFDLSQMETNKLVTGGDDGKVIVFNITEEWQSGEMLEKHDRSPFREYNCGGQVHMVKFHPFIPGVVFTASQPKDGSAGADVIRFWDITKDTNEASFVYSDILQEQLVDVDFHPQGNIVAVTTRDGIVTIFEANSGNVLSKIYPPEKARECQVRWLNTTHLVTLGYMKGNERSLSLWNVADVSNPLKTQSVINNYTMIPYLDQASGVLVIGNVGSPNFNLFHISTTEPYIDPISMFHSKSDYIGCTFFHRAFCNVKEVEIMKCIKLCRDGTAYPVSWTVPRKRKEYFQDDVFPDGPNNSPLMTTDDFFSKKFPDGRNPKNVSFQPENMTPLSQAPVEELSAREEKYIAHKQEEEAEKPKSHLGFDNSEDVKNHFRNTSKHALNSNRWDAKQVSSGKEVDDSEWD